MPLPAVKELIVENEAVNDQYYEARYCQCQSHMHQSSEWRDEAPVRPAEESADDDEDHVEDYQGKKDSVSQEALFGEPAADTFGAAIDVGDDEQEAGHQSRNADAAPEGRIADHLLQAEEI